MPARRRSIGICGGFEMLGGTLFDPDRTESNMPDRCRDWGCSRSILPFSATSWCGRVVTRPSVAQSAFGDAGEIEGYEIHTGEPIYRGALPLFESDAGPDGAIDAERLIFGSFVHDLWKNRTLYAVRSSTGCGCAKV
jgi:adenosylcobyric acid synthase